MHEHRVIEILTGDDSDSVVSTLTTHPRNCATTVCLTKKCMRTVLFRALLRTVDIFFCLVHIWRTTTMIAMFADDDRSRLARCYRFASTKSKHDKWNQFTYPVKWGRAQFVGYTRRLSTSRRYTWRKDANNANSACQVGLSDVNLQFPPERKYFSKRLSWNLFELCHKAAETSLEIVQPSHALLINDTFTRFSSETTWRQHTVNISQNSLLLNWQGFDLKTR